MTKTTKHGITTFHPNCKCYSAPVIKDQFIDDEGDLTYVLENGNTVLADRYNSLWHPVRGKIDWHTKGENPDKRHII